MLSCPLSELWIVLLFCVTFGNLSWWTRLTSTSCVQFGTRAGLEVRFPWFAAYGSVQPASWTGVWCSGHHHCTKCHIQRLVQYISVHHKCCKLTITFIFFHFFYLQASLLQLGYLEIRIWSSMVDHKSPLQIQHIFLIHVLLLNSWNLWWWEQSSLQVGVHVTVVFVYT